MVSDGVTVSLFSPIACVDAYENVLQGPHGNNIVVGWVPVN